MKETKSIFRRILSNTMLIANFGAIIWLLLCYAASVISPVEVGYLPFFSLTTPFAILTNMVFVSIWLFSRRKWKALFSIVALGCLYRMIPAVLGFHFFSGNDWTADENSFKLMSWNVHAMGTFNHPHEKEYAGDIVALIKDEHPDVLCIPEYAMNSDPRKRIHTPRIISENGYRHFYFNEDNDFGPSIRIGTAFFSRYPVVDYRVYHLSLFIYMMQCDVQLRAGKIVRFFVVHLQSYGLSDQDKAAIEEVKQRNTDRISGKSHTLIGKFNQAYIVRAGEADQIATIISKSPYPVMVCGDFNDLPFSYTYTTIRGSLSDAFASKGKGFGRTYNQIIPTLRIDHIFYDPAAVNLKAFKTLRTTLSDHNPVLARFEINSNSE